MRLFTRFILVTLAGIIMLSRITYTVMAEGDNIIPGTYPYSSIYINKEQREILNSRKDNVEMMKSAEHLSKFLPPKRNHPFMYTTREEMMEIRNTKDQDLLQRISKIAQTGDSALVKPLPVEKFKVSELESSEFDSRYYNNWLDPKARELFTVSMASSQQTFIGQDTIRKLWHAYYLTGDKKYSDGVKKWMYNFASYSTWQKYGYTLTTSSTNTQSDYEDGEWFATGYLLPAFAEAYDAIYDELTEQDKNVFKATAFRYAEKIMQDIRTERSWFFKNPPLRLTGNQPAIMICALGMAGVAFHGEIKEAEEWISTAKKYLYMLLEQLPLDGGMAEGPGYDEMIESALNLFMAVLAQAGDKAFVNLSSYKNLQDKYIYLSTPNYKNMLPLGEGSLRYMPMQLPMILVKNYKSSYLQYVVSKNQLFRDIRDILFYDKDVKSESPEGKLLPSKYMSGLNAAVGRTDWSDEAIQVVLKSGKYGQHDHMNENMLLVHAGSDQLLSDGGASSKGYADEQFRSYYQNVKGHNAVMIDGFNQKENYDDGLQYRKGYKQTIDGYFGGDFFKFYSGNSATAVKEVPCEYNIRQVVFLKPGYLIVRDSIKPLDGAIHNYDQLWHSEGKMTLGENKIDVKGEKFSAVVDVLYPYNANISAREGFANGGSQNKATYYAVEQKSINGLFVNLINVTEGEPQKLTAKYYDKEGNNVVVVNRTDDIKDIIVMRDIKNNGDHSFAKVLSYNSDADIFVVSEKKGALKDYGIFNATEFYEKENKLISGNKHFAASITRKFRDEIITEANIELGIKTDDTTIYIKLDGMPSKILINEQDVTSMYRMESNSGFIKLEDLQSDLYRIKLIY